MALTDEITWDSTVEQTYTDTIEVTFLPEDRETIISDFSNAEMDWRDINAILQEELGRIRGNIWLTTDHKVMKKRPLDLITSGKSHTVLNYLKRVTNL